MRARRSNRPERENWEGVPAGAFAESTRYIRNTPNSVSSTGAL